MKNYLVRLIVNYFIKDENGQPDLRCYMGEFETPELAMSKLDELKKNGCDIRSSEFYGLYCIDSSCKGNCGIYHV